MNVFTRLLKLYKSNNYRTPKEDFTTEIFVGILEKNSETLNDYVNNFLNIKGLNFKISSQCHYSLDKPNDCRVDIVISNKDTLIFIENKIDSLEGYGQLEKYSRYLKEIKKKKCYLFYCTKTIDNKKIDFCSFKQFRWRDIYKYYQTDDNLLIKEFLEFLEEEQIVINEKFNFTDMTVMENIVQTISKMDEILNQASEYLPKNFGKSVSYSGRSTQIKRRHRYSTYFTSILKKSGYTDLTLNFNFNKNQYETPHLELSIWIDKSSIFFRSFKEFQYSNSFKEKFIINFFDQGVSICTYKPIIDFLSSETQTDDMKEWFKEQIKELLLFKAQTPQLGWN